MTGDPAVRPAVLGAVALGGALGALARYGLALAWPHASGEPPWSTVGVNVVGCLLMGAFMVVLTEVVGRPHPLARPFVGVGVLGGFTTFSAYTVDAVELVVAGRPALAAAYVLGAALSALLALYAGVVLTRALTRTGGTR